MQTLIILAVLTALPSPEESATSALLDIQESVPQSKRTYVRYLTGYPLPEENQSLVPATNFWIASLSSRRVWKPPVWNPEDQIFRINDYRDYGWTHDAWEKLGAADPYFRVGNHEKSWIDPKTVTALQTATGSKYPILRADFFVARTSLERGGVGFFKGFYSNFRGFPESEQELFKQFDIDEKFLDDNFLLRGGAVLQSPVALHNRELQSIPTVFGRDQRFLWRSFDTISDLDKKSVLRNFRGGIQANGKEFIGSNQNGLHYYFIANGEGKQVAEVPINIARDKDNPHYPGVLNPYSCVRCHGPNSGIRNFEDVITKIILDPNTALAVYQGNDALKYALEEYYQSELGQEIIAHQQSYEKAVFDITGLTPAENTKAYISIVEGYLFNRIDLAMAARECGVTEDQTKILLKNSGNPDALGLVAGNSLSRETWEQAFPEIMGGRVYKWETEIPKLPEDKSEEEAKPDPPVEKVEPKSKQEKKPSRRSTGSSKRPKFFSSPGTSIPR